MKVGLVVHDGRDRSVEAATDAARRLTDLGVEVVAASDALSEPDRLPVALRGPDEFADGLDLAMSFGGDGTFLRAAHLCRDAKVPILGVNLGRLGFLAEVEVDDIGPCLRAVAERSYEVEERPTLEARAFGPDGEEVGRGWALNEVSIEKTERQRLILLDVHVGDALFAKVPADAVVVATATGSTAYAFSAGGPILSPAVSGMCVTPVAPHSLFGRTLVTGEDEEVRVEVVRDQAPAIVSCDGRPPMNVPAGGSVSVRGDGEPVRLARVSPRDFYTLVREKFGLR